MRVERHTERGDTIVEVIVAFAIFAAVIAGTMSIMNLGIANGMRSLEITQVRQQIDAQAEAIRYIHASYVAQYERDAPPPSQPPGVQWLAMKSRGISASQVFSFTANNSRCPTTVAALNQAFFVDYRSSDTALRGGTNIVLATPTGSTLPPYAQVDYSTGTGRAYGMWVQAVPSTPTEPTTYVDFHIRACWESSGSTMPVTLGTIVRLYEPKK